MNAHVAVLQVRCLPRCHWHRISPQASAGCSARPAAPGTRRPPIQPAPACTTYRLQDALHKPCPPTPEPNKPHHRGVTRPPCLLACWERIPTSTYIRQGKMSLMLGSPAPTMLFSLPVWPCPPPVNLPCQPWLCYYPRPPAESLAEQRPLHRNLAPKMAIAPHIKYSPMASKDEQNNAALLRHSYALIQHAQKDGKRQFFFFFFQFSIKFLYSVTSAWHIAARTVDCLCFNCSLHSHCRLLLPRLCFPSPPAIVTCACPFQFRGGL